MNAPDPDGQLARFKTHLADSRLSQAELQAHLSTLTEKDNRINLSQWIRSVRCTAARVGLLTCGELKLALEALSNDDYIFRDLVGFALSETYDNLRQQLRLAVEASP
jgi:hypothetical protein